MQTTEPIRNKHHVKELVNYYLERGQFRNHVLIVLSVHTALRVSDLLRLQWKDVYDFESEQIRASIRIIEKKTGKHKIIALNIHIIRALSHYIAQKNIRPDMFVIENERTHKSICRVQAYRIIRAAAESLGIERVSCHSLRKTFGYHAWKNGAPLAVIVEIYNHSSFAVTRRYLGITQDDKNKVYLELDYMGSLS
jgi:integrase